MSARSFVLAPERAVAITPVRRDKRRIFLSVDGNAAIDLEGGDEVRIERSAERLILADMDGRSFYDTALGKMATT